MSGTLAGKVAIVTGAARGIGAAIAEALAEAGAEVIAADIAGTGEVVARLRAAGHKASACRLDVADEESVRSVTADVVGRLGGIDILVNAAGLFHAAPLLDVTREDWRRVLEVNVIGLAAMVQAAVPSLRARGGRIVNIASIGGRRADEKTMAYSASKAAVISVTQAASLELARDGICVNAIAPGPVRTAMWEAIDRDFSERYLGQPEGRFTALAEGATPMGRLAEPGDIAAVALFLCSPASGHMTGQTVNVDGGVMLS